MEEKEIIKVLAENRPSKFVKNVYSLVGIGNPKLRTTQIVILMLGYIFGIVLDVRGDLQLRNVVVIGTTCVLFVLVFLQLIATQLNNRRILRISKQLDIPLDMVPVYITKYEQQIAEYNDKRG